MSLIIPNEILPTTRMSNEHVYYFAERTCWQSLIQRQESPSLVWRGRIAAQSGWAYTSSIVELNRRHGEMKSPPQALGQMALGEDQGYGCRRA